MVITIQFSNSKLWDSIGLHCHWWLIYICTTNIAGMVCHYIDCLFTVCTVFMFQCKVEWNTVQTENCTTRIFYYIGFLGPCTLFVSFSTRQEWTLSLLLNLPFVTMGDFLSHSHKVPLLQLQYLLWQTDTSVGCFHGWQLSSWHCTETCHHG